LLPVVLRFSGLVRGPGRVGDLRVAPREQGTDSGTPGQSGRLFWDCDDLGTATRRRFFVAFFLAGSLIESRKGVSGGATSTVVG
jgi:hypothetical protein